MKLYTEEELHKAFEDGYLYHAAVGLTKEEQFERQFRDTVYSLTPIELPTDEEIRKESHNYFMRGQLGFEAAADTERAFLRGVLWIRDKILNK